MPMFQIPRRCFGQSSSKDSLNLFSLKLPSDQDGCEIAGWKLLGNCRKYTIEIKSQYFSAWTGPPSVWTVFTSKGLSHVFFH